jgi:hypothetical protein
MMYGTSGSRSISYTFTSSIFRLLAEKHVEDVCLLRLRPYLRGMAIGFPVGSWPWAYSPMVPRRVSSSLLAPPSRSLTLVMLLHVRDLLICELQILQLQLVEAGIQITYGCTSRKSEFLRRGTTDVTRSDHESNLQPELIPQKRLPPHLQPTASTATFSSCHDGSPPCFFDLVINNSVDIEVEENRTFTTVYEISTRSSAISYKHSEVDVLSPSPVP